MNKSIKSRGSAAKIFFVLGGGGREGYEKKLMKGGGYPGPDTTIHYKGNRPFSVVYSPCSICVGNDLTGLREARIGRREDVSFFAYYPCRMPFYVMVYLLFKRVAAVSFYFAFVM